ncbi:hypothetical protein HMN09_00886500 [Mycena chlorophos]|uniref:GST N-terminal domain-containing protein n=1 Tax=Mycena chlorophos TaxID=658473 RepID=A0A8H6W4G3_MYCCL|nr:hypothetical protein HMN09_00886500 [Mycena chlorophos]
MAIVLYDIASTLGTTFSPNVAKTRYCLNVKKLRFTTVWLEYAEIAPLCKKIGAKPTSDDHYTLPVIYDPTTDTAIAGSLEIAFYLDSTYPESVQLISPGTEALHYAFTDAFQALLAPLETYALPATLKVVNSTSQEYFDRTRGRRLGVERLADAIPVAGSDSDVASWKQFKGIFDHINGWFAKSGLYFGGDKLCYADITVAAYLRWIRLVLDKYRWEDISGWHGGRWRRLMVEMERYE